MVARKHRYTILKKQPNIKASTPEDKDTKKAVHGRTPRLIGGAYHPKKTSLLNRAGQMRNPGLVSQSGSAVKMPKGAWLWIKRLLLKILKINLQIICPNTSYEPEHLFD